MLKRRKFDSQKTILISLLEDLTACQDFFLIQLQDLSFTSLQKMILFQKAKPIW